MESGKLKRTDEAESAVADRDGEKTATATEHEVEEFFAILKRMQVARNYLKRSNGNSGDPAVAKRWRHAFEVEDSGEFEGCGVSEDKAEENKDDRLDLEIGVAVAQGPSPNATLDLNSAPANGDVL